MVMPEPRNREGRELIVDEIDPPDLSEDPADTLDQVISEDSPLLTGEPLDEQIQESLLTYDEADYLNQEELDAALVDYATEALDEDEHTG